MADRDVVIRVEPAGVTVDVRAGESMLGALRRNGYTHRFGCRRGGCGVCRVTVLSGQARYPTVVSEQVLDLSERAAGVWLSCRGVPVTDVVIRLNPDDRLTCYAPLLVHRSPKPETKEQGR